MIIEAVYDGRFASVTVPGFPHRTVKPGESAKCRLIEGQRMPGGWRITKGADEYERAVKAANDAREARARAREERRAAAVAAHEAKTAGSTSAEPSRETKRSAPASAEPNKAKAGDQ